MTQTPGMRGRLKIRNQKSKSKQIPDQKAEQEAGSGEHGAKGE